MKARKILKIYLVLFYLTFMTSLLGVAQQFKKLKIEKIEKKELFDVNTGSTDAIVYFYLPNLNDSLKFEPTIKSYLLGKKYNSQERRWELSFAPNKFTLLVVKAFGFEPVELDIEFPAKSITEFQVYEVTKDTPAKLTIRANPPDARISVWSHPQEKKIAEGALVAGMYVLDGLSAGTVRVQLEKEGYSPKDELVTLKNGGELLLNGWELQPLNKLVEINSTPSGAKIFLNEQLNQPIGTTRFFDNIPTGTKKLTFTKDFYKDKTLEINLNESTSFNVELERKSSKVKVAESAEIKISINDEPLDYVNGYYVTNVPLGESRNIKVEKKNYKPYPVLSYTFVNEDEDLDELKKSWQNHFVPRNKINTTQMTVSFVVGLAGLGSGLYLMQSANKNFDAYKKATTSTEAASLRKQVESADRLSPIALGLGGVFTGIGVYFLIK